MIFGKKRRRVLAIGDLHCGHVTGLTPPAYQWHPVFKETQATLWRYFSSTIDKLKPIDCVLVLGDCTDGKGEKAGGTEIFLPDRDDQKAAAINCLKYVGAPDGLMVYGTNYHTATQCGVDVENDIARELGYQIGGHEWADINGLIFDLKHFVGTSSVPYGRHTAVAKERVWNLLWAEHEESPKSDVILRGHVHYHGYQGDPNWLGMTLPGLQGPGSKFGARICSGIIHFGVVCFDVTSKEEYSWKAHTLRFKGLAAPHKL